MKILIIRTHRLGDVLQLTPLLTGLKEKYPKSQITFVTGSDMVDLLSGNPCVDEIVSIPEKEYRYFLSNRPDYYAKVYNEVYDLISRLKQKDFDLIINRQYEFGAVMAFLIGAEETTGGSFSPERSFFFEDDASRELFETIKTKRNTNRIDRKSVV
jgi:ADP-heptose:LPS heptosyltransferase